MTILVMPMQVVFIDCLDLGDFARGKNCCQPQNQPPNLTFLTPAYQP
jgi:hypothetical protein